MDYEAIKTMFKNEGFPIVYEWADKPNLVYPKHSHQDKVSLYVTHGSITFFINDTKISLKAGQRFDVPPQTEHHAIVGPEGGQYIVAQIIENDA